jgi:hypothetical protein
MPKAKRKRKPVMSAAAKRKLAAVAKKKSKPQSEEDLQAELIREEAEDTLKWLNQDLKMSRTQLREVWQIYESVLDSHKVKPDKTWEEMIEIAGDNIKALRNTNPKQWKDEIINFITNYWWMNEFESNLSLCEPLGHVYMATHELLLRAAWNFAVRAYPQLEQDYKAPIKPYDYFEL